VIWEAERLVELADREVFGEQAGARAAHR